MLDIESFSETVWAFNPHCLVWNHRNKRGIIYRGHGHVIDASAPFVKRAQVDYRGNRPETWGT